MRCRDRWTLGLTAQPGQPTTEFQTSEKPCCKQKVKVTCGTTQRLSCDLCTHMCMYAHTYKEVQTCLVMEAKPSPAQASHVFCPPLCSPCVPVGVTHCLNTLIMAYQSWSPGWVGETGSRVRGTVGVSCFSV